MTDVESHKAAAEARRAVARSAGSTRSAAAMARYLGAVMYRETRPEKQASAASPAEKQPEGPDQSDSAGAESES